MVKKVCIELKRVLGVKETEIGLVSALRDSQYILTFAMLQTGKTLICVSVERIGTPRINFNLFKEQSIYIMYPPLTG